MWVTKEHFQHVRELADRAVYVAGQMNTLHEQNKVLQVNLDWLRTRVSQLERERALMLYKFTGVKIETPEFVTAREPDAADIMNNVNAMFQDVGDETARTLGIEHLPDGTLKAE